MRRIHQYVFKGSVSSGFERTVWYFQVGQSFCFSNPVTSSATPPTLFSFAIPTTAINALANPLTTTARKTSLFSFGAAASIPSFLSTTSSAAPTLFTGAPTLVKILFSINDEVIYSVHLAHQFDSDEHWNRSGRIIRSAEYDDGEFADVFYADDNRLLHHHDLRFVLSPRCLSLSFFFAVSIGKPKESSDPMDQTFPPQLHDLIDQFMCVEKKQRRFDLLDCLSFRKTLADSEEHLSDMEHMSTSKFVHVQEEIGRIQRNLLDIQSDVQCNEATFAQINQAYQQISSAPWPISKTWPTRLGTVQRHDL